MVSYPDPNVRNTVRDNAYVGLGLGTRLSVLMDRMVWLRRGGSRVVGKGGSDKYIHNWGRVREGACPLP